MVEEAEGGEFEVGGRFDCLVEVLCVDVEDADVVVEEEEGEKFLAGGDRHFHHFAIMTNVENHGEFYAKVFLLDYDQL